jgi:hypothetical protein
MRIAGGKCLIFSGQGSENLRQFGITPRHMTKKKFLTAALYLQGRKRNSKKTHRKSKQSWYQSISLFMQPFATSLNHDRIILARALNEHSESETGNPTPDRDQQQKTQTKNPRHLNTASVFHQSARSPCHRVRSDRPHTTRWGAHRLNQKQRR